MDTIKLERIQLYGRHGVFAEENRLGQRFYVSLELKLDLSKAGETDDLEHTVNYAEVYGLAKDVVEGETFKLIEALAETLASRILDAYAKIHEVTVRVIKPHPPFDIVFDGVTVELTRRRKAAS
ncbi:dihydroneopterin aldolase [Paenibacillus antri]|uniref:7,8-dihydroneopterin aldolase n=1 Tax=Paenibacillus antri TaxID=2582848 RepID=A0A5R9G561_9BACL|nr:dihydroneopterin aldolase [Paenibacillus antri]TLS48628.1 dihydroneopterin aldolase [Paenibacillus antri]